MIILASTSGRMGIMLLFIAKMILMFLLKNTTWQIFVLQESETLSIVAFYIGKKIIPLQRLRKYCQKEIFEEYVAKPPEAA